MRKAAAALVTAFLTMSIVSCAAAPEVLPGSPLQSTPPSDMLFIDGPIYTSIEQLAAEASLVVTGRFGARTAETTERALLGGEGEGLPLELWEFTIDEVVEGAGAGIGVRIEVIQVGVDADGAVRPAAEGASALLFLTPYSTAGMYAISGLGAGAAYLDGDRNLVAPRGVDPALARELEETSRDELQAVIAEELG